MSKAKNNRIRAAKQLKKQSSRNSKRKAEYKAKAGTGYSEAKNAKKDAAEQKRAEKKQPTEADHRSSRGYLGEYW